MLIKITFFVVFVLWITSGRLDFLDLHFSRFLWVLGLLSIYFYYNVGSLEAQGGDYMSLNILGIGILVAWVISDIFIIVRGLIQLNQEKGGDVDEF